MAEIFVIGKQNSKTIFHGNGDNIVMNRGKITINGKTINIDDPDNKQFSIEIKGDVKELSVDVCEYVKIDGNVTSRVETQSGDVTITGNVSGNVNTMSGDVECGAVGGDVETMSGDVDCGDITGSVESMSGDIKTRKN